MATAGVGQRVGGPRAPQWVALGVAALIILGLTFTLGMLVGRQWARQSQPAVASEPTRKAASVPRRGGLTEVGTERAPQEKLTFYQTLTAPLGAVPPSGKGEATAKPGVAAKARLNPEPAPERTDRPTLPRGTGPEKARLTSVEAKAAEPRQEARAESPVGPGNGHEAKSEWTVQVGVFKSSQQAAGVKKQLAESGFEAQVTPMTIEDGQLRYRVRVGTFRTKEEAVRTAERVRADRSLPTFVTAK